MSVKIGEYIESVGAVAWLQVTGPYGTQTIEGKIDTGFDGYLSLPIQDVSALGLTFASSDIVILANGEEIVLDLHRCTVEWMGVARPVLV